MGSSSTEVSYRVIALKGLLRLCQIRWCIEDSDIALCVQCFDDVLLDDSHEWNDLKNEAIQALVEISKIAPSTVTDIVLPTFLARLPDSSGCDQKEYLTILEGLARLSVERYISETLVRRLLNKLTIVLQAADSSDYPQAILSTLNFLLTGRDLAHDHLLNIYYEALVVNLIKRAAMASVDCDPSAALTDAAMLETIGRLAGKIVNALDEDKQRFVALQAYTLFTDNRTPFVPLLYTQELPHRQRQTIILSAWLLGTVGVVAATSFDTQNLIRELTRKALLESVPLTRQYVLRQVALMINKFVPSTETYHVLDLLRNPSSVLQKGTVVSERTVPVMFWIAKALVLRLERTDEVLQYLLSQLADPAHGPSCAKGFEILLAPDELLSKDNGAIIRLLAGQKVFNACVPHIARETLIAKKAIKPNYLVALSGILRYVPAGVIMSEVDTLVPLLLQSLDLEDAEVKAATVNNFIIIAQDSPKAVEGHLSSLIGRLLRLTATRDTNTPKIRFNALHCLRCLPRKFSESVVVSYRTPVTRGMVEVLDDPKRHIRQEAAQCRAAWLVMDDLED
ncbi:MAG: hypothetical protein Q9214_005995 [Letrouitia sp. 1 TL-2023]